MFDIYSLAKPRVFMMPNVPDVGGGSGIPSDMPAPDSVEFESLTLDDFVITISEEDAEQSQHPEAAGRIEVDIDSNAPKTINIINAASDLGGRAKRIVNTPFTGLHFDHKAYRTEFRPKQGLHNLDFTTPSETPSDNPGGDAPAQ